MASDQPTAREIAHGRWQLDQPIDELRCGCRYLIGTDGLIERRVLLCARHRPELRH